MTFFYFLHFLPLGNHRGNRESDLEKSVVPAHKAVIAVLAANAFHSGRGIWRPRVAHKALEFEFCSPLAGGYLPIDKQEGPEAQYSYYKQTYDTAQASLQGNTGLKGIMFWRWAGVDPTAKLADFDEAATIGECCPRNST